MKEQCFATIGRLGQAASTAIPDEASWSWDDRFRAALVVLSVESASALYDALATVCEHWTVDNVDECPATVGDLVEEMGGLRAGQHLFSTPMQSPSIAYFSSWPWRDQAHVSVRFGAWFPDGDLAEFALSKMTISRGLGI
jgi:hypothetical protein